MTSMFTRGALAGLFALAVAGSAHANLIANGDFEAGVGAGGQVGFSTGYVYRGDQNNCETCVYVNTDPQLDHPLWYSFAAESGANMLIVNGANSQANTTVPLWEEGNGGAGGNISVVPYEVYTFTGYLTGTYPTSPGVLSFLFNGATAGGATVTGAPGAWNLFTVTWFSGANTTLDLQILDLNPDGNGNDFALDNFDLEQTSIPEPASLVAFAAGLTALAAARRRAR